MNSQIGDVGAAHIKSLTNLTELHLGDNEIRDVGAEHIATLTNLTALFLWRNKISDAGFRCITTTLKNLRILSAGFNQIGNSGVKHISALTNLTALYLPESHISDVGVKYIATLNNLNTLSLDNNQVGDTGAKFLAGRTNLIQLDLCRTLISSLIPFSNSFLRMLDVTGTQVSDLSPVRNLLEKGIAARWDNDDWGDGIYVKNCPLIHPPPEIVKQGHEAVLNYFREIDVQGTATLLEAKVLIVGEGRAGKTSLLRRLYQRDKPLPTEDETTRGIDICPHDFRLGDGRTFRLNVWDFGGQQIYHATHQFFLTKNSLYILLDDTAKDAKSVTDESFRYWLEVIDLLSKHSPVLIFQNEKGGRSKSIDIAGIKGRFDNVKEVYSGNLEMPGSVARLAQAIEYQVQQLPHVGEHVPAKWVDIRRALEHEAARTPYITQQDYFKLYGQHLEFDRAKALRLSQYLHDLGVFLHFQDDDVLCKSVILQNRWATARRFFA
jgi:hypothetical protein